MGHSMTTIERALPIERGECTPAKSETTADGDSETDMLKYRLEERLGGTAKPGWSPRKGRRLSTFLGAGHVANGLCRPDGRLFDVKILELITSLEINRLRKTKPARKHSAFC
jgi:hypothetical protein